MGRYKIVYDRDACIGAGSCEAANPENWKLDQASGKAVVGKVEIDDAEVQKNLEAAQACPVAAIKIFNEETGEEVK